MRTGEWRATRASGELSGPEGTLRLEPKVMDLLFLLASRPGEVIGRESIMNALWPGIVVGDDSLARSVFKLRQALGDDARSPRYVETIAKRGYRWCAPVEWNLADGEQPDATPGTGDPSPRAVSPRGSRAWRRPAAVALIAGVALISAWAWREASRADDGSAAGRTGGMAEVREREALLARADDAYFQFSRTDNEAAIELYQRVLGVHPDDPAAMAGLANALVQRGLRWPRTGGVERVEFRRLGDALANGHLRREPQRAQVERARLLAERAVELAPASSAALKALGFVASAQGRFDDALAAYRRAVELDPDAWGPMINIGDVLGIIGRDAEAQAWFERAYAAMERGYADNPARVRPWQADLGVLIAARLHAQGDRTAAEAWYRRVLRHAPLDAAATSGLAAVLRQAGDTDQAARLCTELRQRTDRGCEGDVAQRPQP
ncbi:tetratricopeptide repeat protein [Marilutibacter chinensis]|uniref:Winged helix-turn-helix domain-containing protein n=1 Tax=Marilutibacter chinensis TaxID=2912247 RepID=A0ABS9HU71_9GAMM|nr:tetratricopeptide repeat protein [Lysobacter chinensis]MCF7222233.1 winged helix-turn-helix domain-containing protein [Lysobacter chinensis]